MRITKLDVALVSLSAMVFGSTPATAAAQVADTSHRFALFGGTTPTGSKPVGANGGVEFGGSAAFRLGTFPLPLRASLAFGQESQPLASDAKFGALSLDAIARPVPKIFGTQLYLLGGLGLGTRAEYSGLTRGPLVDPYTLPPLVPFHASRQNWLFAEGGLGLEIGRAFLELKRQVPVASNGYTRTPLSIGFHF